MKKWALLLLWGAVVGLAAAGQVAVASVGNGRWRVLINDDFPTSSSISGSTLTTPYGKWAIITGGAGTVSVGSSGGARLAVASGADLAEIESSPNAAVKATGVWSAVTSFRGTPPTKAQPVVTVDESSGDQYQLQITGSSCQLIAGGTTVAQRALTVGADYRVRLESNGRRVLAFVNGRLVGATDRLHATTTSLLIAIGAQYASHARGTARLSNVVVRVRGS